MKVQKEGGIDAGFIALAVGVVVVAAGGAFFAPSFLPGLGGGKAAVAATAAPAVEGLDREAIKAKLATEAFPDPAGHAFMAALKLNFPAEHDNLLGRLADISIEGGDRSGHILELDSWVERFSKTQYEPLSRTGAAGWDASHRVLSNWISLLEAGAPGCTAAGLEAFVADKKALAAAMTPGSKGYEDLISASRAVVDLAVAGQAAKPVDPTLNSDDARNIRMVLGPTADERIIAGEVIERLGDGSNYNPLSAQPDLNLCTLARSGLKQMHMLPASTKAKLMAASQL